MWEVLIISHILLKKGSNWYMDTGVRDLKVVFFKATVQLRYIRTTHTRIIRSYFAYTRMYIRVYAYVYTRIRVCQYARICPFVMHSYKFLYIKRCWSNKGHIGMKRLQSEICIL